ncbi:CDC48 family AAA ATPase [Dethiosulfovibrio salsuginis]|uniref:Transitional endoplasmic reticulum ATPase n=1 Tax=Dethiosulfovibrio salsuginis TaxID=561720 RepID=A0A1X7JS97_9BACT|nr:CDC48 family AAA ATPase [Dethiosulfovibrio salsuginis]SMG30644.1 transitional endoplasmic reticulum ATPase [Dethiosulfovibrio salsuginis]
MLQVKDGSKKDIGRGIVRMDPADMGRLGLSDGEIVEIKGTRRTPVRLLATDHDNCGQEALFMDNLTRGNAGLSLDDRVSVHKVQVDFAMEVTIKPMTTMHLLEKDLDPKPLKEKIGGLPVIKGDRIRLSLGGGRDCDFQIVSTKPGGSVMLGPATELTVEKRTAGDRNEGVKYKDIGGLSGQLSRIREMIELPLRFPQAFLRLGVEPPKGVLLYGPPGTGKTVIAKAVANETEAWFTHISGPEIIGKYYGESEQRLRQVFEEAQAHAPSIIFIDEIDAIAPKREEMGGEKQVERRVVAQLLALMDGLQARGQIVVIAATNLPNSIDPALRRPGRFDREVPVPIPDRKGREEILQIHTRGMPLARDVDLSRIAEVTHGFVGADLEVLAKEAAMAALRGIMPSMDFEDPQVPYDRLRTMEIDMKNFSSALREVEPSAIREVFVERPNVTWDDVGGLDDVAMELREAVQWPLEHGDVFRRFRISPPKGIMIHGPSGTGKTLMVKALARESGANYISVKGPSLMSRYVGESERAIREVFRKAKQAAPSLLCFDEIESLVPVRGKDGGASSQFTDRVISQFLSEMGGMEDMDGVMVLATTNRIDLIDPAMFSAGRFDMVIELPLPDHDGRRAIFQVNLREKPLAQDVDLGELAKATEGATGGEISMICRMAATDAVREYIRAGETGQPTVEMRHFRKVLASRGRKKPVKEPQ